MDQVALILPLIAADTADTQQNLGQVLAGKDGRDDHGCAGVDLLGDLGQGIIAQRQLLLNRLERHRGITVGGVALDGVGSGIRGGLLIQTHEGGILAGATK